MPTKNKIKKKYIAAAVIALVAALGLGGLFLFKGRNTSTVTTYPVAALNEYGYFDQSSSISGKVVDEFSQNVTLREDFTLKRVHVRKGQKVKKGDTLVSYDARRDELEMKLKEIEVLKRERDVQNRETALENLRRTGKDTYKDSSNLPDSDNDIDDDENDAEAPTTRSWLLKAVDGLLSPLDNPAGTVVNAEEGGEEDSDGSDDAADQEKADEVTALIEALTDESDETAVTAAREAYDALTADQKKLVTDETVNKLLAQENRIVAEKVTAIIDTLTDESEESEVTAARKAYDALSDEQKNLVTEETKNKLEAQENRIAAGKVTALIDALTDKSEESEVTAAREAFDALSDEQKDLVTGETKNKLEAQENRIAAEKVISYIEALTESSSQEEVSAARNAFEALTADQKSLISKEVLAKLEDLENKIADKVAKTLSALTNSSSSDDVSAARTAYDALTSAQKKRISADALNNLIAAEVAVIINKLSDSSSSSAVKAARAAYNALTDAQKKKITKETLAKLVAQENRIKSTVTLSSLVKSIDTSAKEDYEILNGSTLEVYIKKGETDVTGSVINKAIAYAAKGKLTKIVFKRYKSQSDYDNGKSTDYTLTIKKGSYLTTSLDSSGTYTLEYIKGKLKQASSGVMKITSSTKNATKTVYRDNSYTYKLKVNSKTISSGVTWSLKGNKSKKTKIGSSSGKLSIASGETASKLKITAKFNGISKSIKVKVKKSGSGSSGSGSSSDRTYERGSGENIDNDDDTVYTGEELREHIADREEELEDAKLELEEARIKYQELKAKVDSATVKASMSGTVIVAYSKNNLPESGQPIVVIKSRGGTYVQFSVNEMNLDIIKKGGTLQCRKDDYYDGYYYEEEDYDDDESSGSKLYEAVVTDIADYPSSVGVKTNDMWSEESSANPNSSYYTVTGTIKNANGLKSGDALTVAFDSKSMGTEENASVIVMAPFIRQEGRRYYVYKVGKENRLVKQYVQIGKTSYGYTQILSGLDEGDYIAFPYDKNELDDARTKKEEDATQIIETLYEAPEFMY